MQETHSMGELVEGHAPEAVQEVQQDAPHQHLMGGRARDAALYRLKLTLEMLKGMRDHAFESAGEDTDDTATQTAEGEDEEGGEAAPAPAPGDDGTLPVLGITSFDPEGDGDERNDLTPLAVDGDPETAWTSHTYLSPGWGSLKSGTGLVLDLGEDAEVSEVVVDLAEGDMGATLYLADEPTIDGATELGSDDEASGYTLAEHVAAVSAHAPDLSFDHVIADPQVARTEAERAALEAAVEGLGASLVLTTVGKPNRPGVHDTLRLAAAYRDVMSGGHG